MRHKIIFKVFDVFRKRGLIAKTVTALDDTSFFDLSLISGVENIFLRSCSPVSGRNIILRKHFNIFRQCFVCRGKEGCREDHP